MLKCTATHNFSLKRLENSRQPVFVDEIQHKDKAIKQNVCTEANLCESLFLIKNRSPIILISICYVKF